MGVLARLAADTTNMATDPRIQDRIDALLDRSREQLRAELATFVREMTESARADQEEAARSARTAAEAAAAALASEAIAAERAAAADRQAAAVAATAAAATTARAEALDALRTDLETERRAAVDAVEARAEQDLAAAVAAWRTNERQAEIGTAAALADGIRALDDARTLSDVLDALVLAAAPHASRVALVVSRDGALRGWRWHGFEGDAHDITVAFGAPGLVGTAHATGQVQSASDASMADGVLSPRRPARAAIAVPLTVDGRSVGVLYADDDGETESRTVPSAWPETIEVLVRHAARCLEAATARRMPELLRASAAERVRLQSSQQDDESAERYARLLVAEIKLYHEAAVDEARRAGDILRRLRPQIDRAERLYAERVPETIRHRTKYFEQELVRTLAGGNAALLGQAT